MKDNKKQPTLNIVSPMPPNMPGCTLLINRPAIGATKTIANGQEVEHEVIIPTSIGQYEEWGVSNLTHQIDGMLSVNPQLHLAGLLVTMWHNAPLVVQGEARMREAFPGRVFRTVIRRTDKVGESAYYRESLLDYSPTSAAAKTISSPVPGMYMMFR